MLSSLEQAPDGRFFVESSSLACEIEGGGRTWDWEFSLSLQESGICGDELLGLFIEVQDQFQIIQCFI